MKNLITLTAIVLFSIHALATRDGKISKNMKYHPVFKIAEPKPSTASRFRSYLPIVGADIFINSKNPTLMPELVLSDKTFKKVLFGSVNLKVNPEELNILHSHPQGYLFHTQFLGQQVALFFKGFSKDEVRKVVEELKTTETASGTEASSRMPASETKKSWSKKGFNELDNNSDRALMMGTMMAECFEYGAYGMVRPAQMFAEGIKAPFIVGWSKYWENTVTQWNEMTKGVSSLSWEKVKQAYERFSQKDPREGSREFCQVAMGAVMTGRAATAFAEAYLAQKYTVLLPTTTAETLTILDKIKETRKFARDQINKGNKDVAIDSLEELGNMKAVAERTLRKYAWDRKFSSEKLTEADKAAIAKAEQVVKEADAALEDIGKDVLDPKMYEVLIGGAGGESAEVAMRGFDKTAYLWFDAAKAKYSGHGSDYRNQGVSFEKKVNIGGTQITVEVQPESVRQVMNAPAMQYDYYSSATTYHLKIIGNMTEAQAKNMTERMDLARALTYRKLGADVDPAKIPKFDRNLNDNTIPFIVKPGPAERYRNSYSLKNGSEGSNGAWNHNEGDEFLKSLRDVMSMSDQQVVAVKQSIAPAVKRVESDVTKGTAAEELYWERMHSRSRGKD
jgi:hypothetical protein